MKDLASDTVRFSPPLYQQRYRKVLDVLSKHKPKKVVDFGCAECKFLRLATKESYIEELCGVDVIGEILESSKHQVEPLISDYLHPKEKLLTVHLYQGSVLEYDSRFHSFDAVVCIELLEHLKPAVLCKFSKNVFGVMRPKLVIITTPNADFNSLFSLDGKLRHWDHKFEWTRNQFQIWCKLVSVKYGYTYHLDGVGMYQGCEDLGPCSQMAIFAVDAYSSATALKGQYCLYKLMFETAFPYKTMLQKCEEKMLFELTESIQGMVTACLSWPNQTSENPEWKCNEIKTLSTQKLLSFQLSHYNGIFNFHTERFKCFLPLKSTYQCMEGQFENDYQYFTELDINFYHLQSCFDVKETLHSANLVSRLQHLYLAAHEQEPIMGQFDDAVVPIEITLSNDRGSVDVLLTKEDNTSQSAKQKIVCTETTTKIPTYCLLKLWSFDCGIYNLIEVIQKRAPAGLVYDHYGRCFIVENVFFNQHSSSLFNSSSGVSIHNCIRRFESLCESQKCLFDSVLMMRAYLGFRYGNGSSVRFTLVRQTE